MDFSRYQLPVLAALTVAALGVGYQIYRLQEELRETVAHAEAASHNYGTIIESLQKELANASSTNAALAARLLSEEDRNNAYGREVQSLASNVALLEKLSKTDRELLQKYSDVYFLSDTFVPAPLADIQPSYIIPGKAPLQIHAHIKPHLEALLAAANTQGYPLSILSAYRSFGKQASLKEGYTVVYGIGANRFSADQGYSEHQLGSTVDFTTPSGAENLGVFEKSRTYTWLTENAHKYGFILSYPKNNKFFQFEPWHWRFVGRELATRLHHEGTHFYDLDQREINQYLVKIFD